MFVSAEEITELEPLWRKMMMCAPVVNEIFAYLPLGDWLRMRMVSSDWRDGIDRCLRSELKSVDLRVLVPSYVRGMDAKKLAAPERQKRIALALELLTKVAPNLEKIIGFKGTDSSAYHFRFPKGSRQKVQRALSSFLKLKVIDTDQLFEALRPTGDLESFVGFWNRIGPNLEELTIRTCRNVDFWNKVTLEMKNLKRVKVPVAVIISSPEKIVSLSVFSEHFIESDSDRCAQFLNKCVNLRELTLSVSEDWSKQSDLVEAIKGKAAQLTHFNIDVPLAPAIAAELKNLNVLAFSWPLTELTKPLNDISWWEKLTSVHFRLNQYDWEVRLCAKLLRRFARSGLMKLRHLKFSELDGGSLDLTNIDLELETLVLDRVQDFEICDRLAANLRSLTVIGSKRWGRAHHLDPFSLVLGGFPSLREFRFSSYKDWMTIPAGYFGQVAEQSPELEVIQIPSNFHGGILKFCLTELVRKCKKLKRVEVECQFAKKLVPLEEMLPTHIELVHI